MESKGELPKAEIVRFYAEFIATPLARIRDWLRANHSEHVNECALLVNAVNHMDDPAVQDRIF